MSKFIDKLVKLNKSEPAPIGFRRVQTETVSKKIQLVACREKPGDTKGADADLLVINAKKDIDAESIKKMPDDKPWGCRLKEGGLEEVKQLKEAGCDFIVISVNAPLAIIEEKEIGKVIEIDTSIPDAVLRSVLDLPVNAVLVSVAGSEDKSLTFNDLMVLQRFGRIPGKPLFAILPANVTSNELEVLWEAGVVAVAVEGSITKMRAAIDKADFKSVRKHDKNEPVLHQVGQIGFGAEKPDEEPEEEPDEE
jgi:hypothetical protein